MVGSRAEVSQRMLIVTLREGRPRGFGLPLELDSLSLRRFCGAGASGELEGSLRRPFFFCFSLTTGSGGKGFTGRAGNAANDGSTRGGFTERADATVGAGEASRQASNSVSRTRLISLPVARALYHSCGSLALSSAE